MIDRDEAERLLEDEGHLYLHAGADAGADEDAGPVLRVYLDEYTGWPSFCTIASRTEGQETLVALHQAEPHRSGTGVQVPYDRARVDTAPTVRVDQDLSISEEDDLFDYYGVPIDGVTPVVDHLGSVLVPHAHGDDTHVAERDTDHPSD